MLLDEIKNIRDDINLLAKKYGATDLKLFGSVACRKEKKSSDIDILISLPKGYDMFKQRIPLAEDLEKLLGRKVDLVVKHEINKHISKEILNSAKKL